MLAVADVKTLWRRRPFEALAKYRSVVGFIPEDPVSFFFGDPSVDRVGVAGTLGLRRVLVPPGWASWSAWIGQDRPCRHDRGRLRCDIAFGLASRRERKPVFLNESA